MKKEIVKRSEPWIDFVEQTLERVIGGSPLARLMPPRDLAHATITFYLGVNVFTHLDADRSRAEALFDLAGRARPGRGHSPRRKVRILDQRSAKPASAPCRVGR